MSIPESVKVAGIEYKVKHVPVVIIDGSTDYAGCCDYETSTIELLNTLNDDKKEQIFIHELIHAMLYEAGYLLKDHDEEKVTRLGIVLYQVLKDNKLEFIGD